MQGEIVARSYASALFELADAREKLEEYGDALEEIARLLDEQPLFAQFLETPRIGGREKKRVLRETFEGRIPEHVLNFLFLVLDKRRQRLLRDIAREYHDLLDDRMGRTHVDVTVARPVDDAFLDELKDRLAATFEKDVVPHVRVDPALVGGIVVRRGDTIFDGSVRRRLEGLRRRLLAAEVSAE